MATKNKELCIKIIFSIEDAKKDEMMCHLVQLRDALKGARKKAERAVIKTKKKTTKKK